jgi:hypothetical protein
MKELAEGLIRVAETGSGLLLGEVVDEDGPEGLVLTLPSTRRVEEETAEW